MLLTNRRPDVNATTIVRPRNSLRSFCKSLLSKFVRAVLNAFKMLGASALMRFLEGPTWPHLQAQDPPMMHQEASFSPLELSHQISLEILPQFVKAASLVGLQE